MSPSTGPTSGGPNNLFHLPVRSQRLNLRGAAIHLGISPARLRLLRLLGTGPAHTTQDSYKIEDLDRYIARLYEQADISMAEMARRRSLSAGARHSAITIAASQKQSLPIDPFMVMATRDDIIEHAVYFLLKAMALFGLIMLCVSVSPLLKTHLD